MGARGGKFDILSINRLCIVISHQLRSELFPSESKPACRPRFTGGPALWIKRLLKSGPAPAEQYRHQNENPTASATASRQAPVDALASLWGWNPCNGFSNATSKVERCPPVPGSKNPRFCRGLKRGEEPPLKTVWVSRRCKWSRIQHRFPARKAGRATTTTDEEGSASCVFDKLLHPCRYPVDVISIPLLPLKLML